nr:hypothetical protein [Escherichia coli]
MNAETIKDFLVSLGFSVDDAGAKKFGSVLAGTTANVIKMGLAVEGAALSVAENYLQAGIRWETSTPYESLLVT